MSSETCPYCGCTERQIRYNKWHIKEIYCAECYRCLNKEQVQEQVALAQRAEREGKINEFYFGQYNPDPD